MSLNWWQRLTGRLTRWLRATWAQVNARDRRSSDANHLPAPQLPGTPLKVSVVIPALNEARRIGDVVRYAFSDPACGEVIVIDDSSIDDTVTLARDAGATVITSTMLGKGASMEDGYRAAQYEVVVYLDGDLAGLRPNIISDLAFPITTGGADMVKAAFGRGGGRVTELTAKPMLKIFFPELVRFSQPLGGIVAMRKQLLSSMSFESGYGVDVGLLIDAHMKNARITEVDIGSLDHESQSLQSLGLMAQEVSRVILDRAKHAGRLTVEHILAVFEIERQNQTDIDSVLGKLRDARKLVLLDMDSTITNDRFVVELARATGRTDALSKLLDVGDDAANIDAIDAIAALFRFVHQSEFEHVAKNLALRPGVIETVNQLRRNGYKVGVVSDSYFIAAEIVRRRIFADFALAHTMQFDRGTCQGVVRINRSFSHDDGCRDHVRCKSNVLRYMINGGRSDVFEHVMAVGNSKNDLCLLELADAGFTLEPRHSALGKSSRITELYAMGDLLLHMRAPTGSSDT